MRPFLQAAGAAGKRLPLLAALLGAVVLAGLAFSLLRWAGVPDAPATPAPVPLSTEEAAQTVVSAQPFGASGEAAPAAYVAGGNLRLLGTVASRGRLPGLALIGMPEGGGQAVPEGETVDGIGKVVKIADDSVEIVRDGATLILRMPEHARQPDEDGKP